MKSQFLDTLGEYKIKGIKKPPPTTRSPIKHKINWPRQQDGFLFPYFSNRHKTKATKNAAPWLT